MHGEQRKTEYGRYRFSVSEWIRYAVEGAGLGGFTVWICYRSFRAAPVAAVIAAIFIKNRKKRLMEERKQKLDYHFRDFLSSLHTNMLAGYSLENAVKSASRDMDKLYGKNDVLSRELHEMVRQMNYGVQIDELFRDLGRRSDLDDVRNFGEVIYIARRTGGNMEHVLDSAWRNIAGKIDTKQEIDTILAARKYEQILMNLMPAGIVLYLRLTFEGFVEQMYGNVFGVIVMSACLTLYLAAIAVGNKIMGSEV